MVDSFSYLGVLFDEDHSWTKLVKIRGQGMQRSLDTVKRFASKLGGSPLDAIKNIYLAKTKSATTYGAGVWGMVNAALLQQMEDSFFKNRVSLPQLAPNYILHLELGLPYVIDTVRLAPLLLWHSIW